MATHYRQATTDDLDGIVETFLGCWRVSYAVVLPRQLTEAMTDERAVELWMRVLGEVAGADVIVAESPAELGTVILGVARLAVGAGGEGSVPSLYVSPRAQGRGVGSGLLAAAADALLAAGSITAHLWVFRDNAPARAFYRHNGWYPDGRTRVQPEFGEPEIRLTALLCPGRPAAAGPRTSHEARA